MDWVELFGSYQYDLPLEVDPGAEFVGGEAYPDAVVTAADLLYPRRILIQRLDITAEDRSTDRKENIRIYRVAVETEDGDLVELRRLAIPCDDISNVDVSKCAGCGTNIPEGQHVIIDRMAYHKRCVEDGDGDTQPASSGSNYSGDSSDDGGGADNDLQGREEREAEDGVAPSPPQTTVTKTRSDDGISVSHLVGVTKLSDDRDIVTLWSREFGSLSGTVTGRWSTGLFHGELPTKTDADYIDEKFFKGAGVVTASDLRVWNRLYKEAFRELHPPLR